MLQVRSRRPYRASSTFPSLIRRSIPPAPAPFTSPAIAPITLRLVEAIPTVEVVVAEAPSAINVAKWDTLRVRALSRLGVEEEVDMVEAIMERLVVVHRRLGMAPFFY